MRDACRGGDHLLPPAERYERERQVRSPVGDGSDSALAPGHEQLVGVRRRPLRVARGGEHP